MAGRAGGGGRWGVMTALVLVMAASAWPAQAGPEGGRGPWREELRREGGDPGYERRGGRGEAAPRRDDAYDAPRQPTPQRLSPEERRQLRRDVNDAGRELYAPRR